MTRLAEVFAVSLMVTGACSASATLSELSTAERRADAGDVDGSIAAYRVAQTKCGALRPKRRAKATCASALLGEAEVLEHAGRTRASIDAYLAIPARASDDPTTSATAVHRAGELLLREGDETAARTALWRVISEWPDEQPAGDALRVLLEDGRHRNARALADQISKALTPLADHSVADNLVWSLADLHEHELANISAARSFYDRIPVDYPKSGLRDDARWHAARLSKTLGDPQGAVDRLRALVATREVAFGAGSYFSVWLDNAQLELGRILRDELDDLPAAIAAFERLPKHYPASILRDDALFELAITHARAGDPGKACATFAKLEKQSPQSKYLARRSELACP
ncbi:MAG: tetratricopeptide repeat protein [Deltaproteobacteria bacterium]|nr:tetratricopeptide repeat protein [Deltaproteobacteria bacterium]